MNQIKKSFYRVCNIDTQQGLWYDQAGNFTGLIHGELNFCTNSNLQMPFDAEIVGWLSATETIEELFNWFSKSDIEILETKSFYIMRYESKSYKTYANHWVINQYWSSPIEVIPVRLINI